MIHFNYCDAKNSGACSCEPSTFIADTSIRLLFEIEVILTEDAPVEQGQGDFEIASSSLSIVWVKFNGQPWQCSKVKVRGNRLDNGSIGLRVWTPIDGDELPTWIRVIVAETSPRQEN